MAQLIVSFFFLILKYTLLYIFLYLHGRAFILIINKILVKKKELPNKLLNLDSKIIYPVFGLIFFGNLLIFLNYFFPLKSQIVLIVSLFLLLINLLEFKIDLEISRYLKWKNFLYYFVFPSILIMSSSNTFFHYDAGYYHLNHQNWLRESNMIFGMVNIFWPFGMSSIYEYISAFFWIDSSFILLHFLNLYFIHFFFLFISENVLKSKINNLKIASMFILIFAILDNFGINGGRNGFLYIQGVGKQDVAVAVLFCFTTLTTLTYIRSRTIKDIDYILISIIPFFIFQLKVSGVVIFYLFIIFNYLLIKEKKINIKRLSYLQIPTILFAISWFVKSYLTTGCIIFPLNFTCINNFDWYILNSTLAFEEISTVFSLAFLEYFMNDSKTFSTWFNDFFYSEDYEALSNFYRGVYLNYFYSFVFIYLIKRFFTTKSIESKQFKSLLYSYVFVASFYLLFFGPIPRYTMGIMLTIIGCLGFFTKDFKISLNKKLIYLVILLAISMVPRLNSYVDFINNKEIAISDPRTQTFYEEISISGSWIKPDKGDRCWINLNCTMNYKEEIIIIENGNYKTAYILENNSR